MVKYFYILFWYAKIIFILFFGCVGYSYCLPNYCGLSIKFQVQKLEVFFRYVQMSIVTKMKCFSKIVVILFLVVWVVHIIHHLFEIIFYYNDS